MILMLVVNHINEMAITLSKWVFFQISFSRENVFSFNYFIKYVYNFLLFLFGKKNLQYFYTGVRSCSNIVRLPYF